MRQKRRLRADDRGVSEVIGAILVFGLMIALLAVMQTQAIPAANEEVEFNHNQKVQNDLVQFQETASRVAAGGNAESTAIKMGATYPSRLLFFNPQNPGGQIRTSEESSVSIQNVNATDPVVNKNFAGSLTGLETKRIEYRPQYNEYENPPVTTLEYGAVYRDFDNKAIIDDPGQIISGNTISLTFFTGNLSRTTSRTMSLQAQPNSAPARTVTVEPTASEMTIVLPTNLNATDWEKIVGDEKNVVDIRDVQNGDAVAIDLVGSETYNLRMSRIGVGGGVTPTEAAYIAPIRSANIQSEQANRVPIEVRDKFNNPVSGETVNLSVSSGQFQNGQQEIESRTSEDGRPAAQYFTGQTGTVEVEGSFNKKPSNPAFDPEENPEDFRISITFNPQLDDIDPTIEDHNIGIQTYSVCGGSGTIDSISCATGGNTIQMYQVTADYNVSDDGGSGLDHLNVRIFDGNSLITESSQSISGASKEGRFVSPLFPETEGVPDGVEIWAYDTNGNSDNVTEDNP